MDSPDQVVSSLVLLESMGSTAHLIVNVKDKPVVILSRDVVIARQGDTVADVNFRVQMASTDGIVPNHAPVRTVHIAMEQTGGAYAQQDSREINVNKSVRKERLARHVVNLATVESSNVTPLMESVSALLEDMDHCVKRSVELEDMERHVRTSVNVSTEHLVIPKRRFTKISRF